MRAYDALPRGLRRGLDPNDRVTITIEPDELIPGRREAHARVVAAGLTDEDTDRLIDEARTEAHRSSDEGCRHQCFHQRGSKGKIATRYGGSSRGGEPPSPQIHDHRARAVRHPGPAASCAADPATLHVWLSEILAAAELVAITERIAACRDPKDDKFLELAINGHADLNRIPRWPSMRWLICLELSLRKPSWLAFICERANRPDIWAQAI